MCKRLGVSTSGYYEWRARPPSQRSINDRVMTEHIRQIHKMSDETYGRARVQAELRDMGFCVNHKRIERLMKLANLQGVSRRRGYVVTTQRDRHAKAAPDLVKRQFTATGINQLWVADMTYVPTWVGFLYLAVVVDAYHRLHHLQRQHPANTGAHRGRCRAPAHHTRTRTASGAG
jgi:putative transposase